jgi:hypothetical protein
MTSHIVRTSVTAASAIAILSLPAAAQRAVQPAAFDRGFVVGGDWLQANALPLDRNAMQSVAFDASLRRSHWALDAGWMRIARTLSTVQGGTLSIGAPLAWNRLLLIPAVGGFVGQAQRSVDSTGYDWTDGAGHTGHTARYSYSSATAIGGGGSLTLEVPVYRFIAIRASGSTWYFGGAPLEGDRTRTTVGVGLSLRLQRFDGGRR